MVRTNITGTTMDKSPAQRGEAAKRVPTEPVAPLAEDMEDTEEERER